MRERERKKNYFITVVICILNVLNNTGCSHIFVKYLYFLHFCLFMWNFLIPEGYWPHHCRCRQTLQHFKGIPASGRSGPPLQKAWGAMGLSSKPFPGILLPAILSVLADGIKGRVERGLGPALSCPSLFSAQRRRCPNMTPTPH